MEHKELDVWKRSMELVEVIYRVTEKLPKSEIYRLSSQMRSAAVSIPSNIAEGAARKGSKEFIQFIHIALGSLAELETQYILAQRLGYLEDDENTSDLITSVKRLLLGTRNFMQRN